MAENLSSMGDYDYDTGRNDRTGRGKRKSPRFLADKIFKKWPSNAVQNIGIFGDVLRRPRASYAVSRYL